MPACRSTAPSAPPAAMTRMISPASTTPSGRSCAPSSARDGARAGPVRRQQQERRAGRERQRKVLVAEHAQSTCTSQPAGRTCSASSAESALMRSTGSRIGSSESEQRRQSSRGTGVGMRRSGRSRSPATNRSNLAAATADRRSARRRSRRGRRTSTTIGPCCIISAMSMPIACATNSGPGVGGTSECVIVAPATMASTKSR